MTKQTETETEALAVMTAPFEMSAAGVGGMLEATREFLTDNQRAELVPVVDPDTGIKVIGIVDTSGGVRPLPVDFFDSARNQPRFRRGTAAMTTLDSFIDHVKRFGDDGTAVFADDNRSTPKMTAVLDYHYPDFGEGPTRTQAPYRFGRHRTTFAFPLSDEWKAWIKKDGVVMTMGDFATFLEDRLADIAGAGDDYPEHVSRLVEESGGPDRIATYAALMELARGLHVYENAQVEEAVNLSSGEGSVRFSIEHETRTRTGGSVKVPKLFFIAIPIFNKGAFYRIASRLRYRKTLEGLKFWFELYRADLSFDHAFAEAVEKVDAETPAAVFFGAPEA